VCSVIMAAAMSCVAVRVLGSAWHVVTLYLTADAARNVSCQFLVSDWFWCSVRIFTSRTCC